MIHRHKEQIPRPDLQTSELQKPSKENCIFSKRVYEKGNSDRSSL
jgi:hypothetical protein